MTHRQKCRPDLVLLAHGTGHVDVGYGRIVLGKGVADVVDIGLHLCDRNSGKRGGL
ncbi:MAG: hypothetical protein AAGI50_17300 [Pseudomonadota bacterium]